MLELRQLETFTPSNHTDTEACTSTPILHDSVLSSDRPDKKKLRQPIARCDWLSPEGAESSEMIGMVREDDEDDAALQDRYNYVCTQSHNAAKSTIQNIDTHKLIHFTGSIRCSDRARTAIARTAPARWAMTAEESVPMASWMVRLVKL